MISLYLIILIITLIIIFYKYFQIKETYVGDLRVANETDKNRAIKFALETLCKKKGHRWIPLGGELEFDCKFTKKSCINESVYPTPENKPAKYYEWRDSKSEDAQKVVENTLNSKSKNIDVYDVSQETLSKKAGLSSASQKKSDILDKEGLCIIGNEYFRKFCEDNNLTYNKDTGACVTNEPYCLKRVLPFCDGDCYKPPGSWLAESVLGTTLGRSLAALENYSYAGICKAANKS
jgi:hypothetical protein